MGKTSKYILVTVLRTIICLACFSCPALAADFAVPKTVDEAANRLLSELSADSAYYLLRKPREDLAEFHFFWGMQIRNTFGLWRGNQLLMKSCDEQRPSPDYMHPDICSGIIIETVWMKLRERANPLLVGALDHQFAMMDRVNITDDQFDRKSLKQVIALMNDQIRSQLPQKESLSISTRGRYEADKAVNFDVRHEGPMPLLHAMLWMAVRNNFRVWYEPAEIIWEFE